MAFCVSWHVLFPAFAEMSTSWSVFWLQFSLLPLCVAYINRMSDSKKMLHSPIGTQATEENSTHYKGDCKHYHNTEISM
jgi:hypothetical protein